MDLLEQYESGELSAPEAFIEASQMIKLYSDIKDKIYEKAVEVAREFNKDEQYYGMNWEIRGGKTTYDFEKSETFRNANSELKKVKADLTAATKAKESGKGFFDQESGDVMETVPIKSVSRDVLIFKPI